MGGGTDKRGTHVGAASAQGCSPGWRPQQRNAGRPESACRRRDRHGQQREPLRQRNQDEATGKEQRAGPCTCPPSTADSPLCPAGWRAVAPGAQAGAFQSWRAQGRGGALSQSPCALAGGPGRTKRSQWSLQDVYAGVPRPRQALWGAGPTTRGLQQGDAGDPQFLPPEPARPGLSLPR